MSFGLEIIRDDGVLSYSSTDVTWNQVDYFRYAAKGTIYREYPFLVGRQILVTQVMIDPPPIDRKAIAPKIVVGTASVSVSGGSEDAFILVLMR